MMNTQDADRLGGFGTTIFTETTELARRTGSINLCQGFPEESGPRVVIDAAQVAIREGANQYPPLPGIPELREAVAAQRPSYDPNGEILVTLARRRRWP